MSFSSETKSQLAKLVPHSRCCREAEFLALTKSDGTLRIGGGAVSLVITTENTAAAAKVYRLSKELFDRPGEITTYRKLRLQKNNVYEIVIPYQPAFVPLFRYMGLDAEQSVWTSDFEDIFPWEAVQKDCCKRAYLRGSFLAAGSVNRPDSPCHLEIVCERRSHAEALRRIMAELSIHSNVFCRKGQYIVYLKGGDAIIDFLNHIGAHRALLAFEDARIKKDIRNNINRRNNFDMANVEKTINTSLLQRQAIQRLCGTSGLDSLDEGLRQVAELRLEWPEESYAELAARADPPLTKSSVSRRLRKLVEMAEETRSS